MYQALAIPGFKHSDLWKKMQILPVGICIQLLVAVDAYTSVSLFRKQDSGEAGAEDR